MEEKEGKEEEEVPHTKRETKLLTKRFLWNSEENGEIRIRKQRREEGREKVGKEGKKDRRVFGL